MHKIGIDRHSGLLLADLCTALTFAHHYSVFKERTGLIYNPGGGVGPVMGPAGYDSTTGDGVSMGDSQRDSRTPTYSM